MDEPAMAEPVTLDQLEALAPCPVADTMRRVQEQLRRGAAPTFEALFAFGEPSTLR